MTVEALRKDMVAAMKAKDKTTKDAVSSLISAVKKAAIDEGCREDVPEALVDRVILKELKTVKEQLDTCPENRDDLRAEYQARYDVIAKYAPQQMSAEIDGKLVCGAGGGGFLQVILKKGVTRQQVEERLNEVFMDSLVGVADCRLVWE